MTTLHAPAPNRATDCNRLLTETEVSTLTGLSLSWIQKDRHRRRLLPYIRVGQGTRAPIRYHLGRVMDALGDLEEGGSTTRNARRTR